MAGPKPVSLIDLAAKYDTRDKCLDLLESLRWPDGPACSKCGSCKAYRLEKRRLWECGDCGYQYSATSGTIMHDTRLELRKWVLAIALICNARKGVSAYQMSRDLHVTYKTAWYLGHRLRGAMRETAWLEKFRGICEVDESYIGGRRRGSPRGRPRADSHKMPVFGVRERGGKVRLLATPNVTARTLVPVIRQYVSTDAEMVVADQLSSYNQLAAEFSSVERINHTREYVRGQIHTNSIESIWAIVKRQVSGTHHKLSRQYLPLYLSEISYRFNNRENPDMFLAVLKNGMMTDPMVLRLPE